MSLEDTGGVPPFWRRMTTRRRFLAGATGTVVSASSVDAFARMITGEKVRGRVATVAAQDTGISSLLGVNPLPGSKRTLLITRREDFVFLQLDLFDMEISGNQLSLTPGASQGYAVFSLPPQHVVEQAFVDTSAQTNPYANPNTKSPPVGTPVAPGATQARLAGPSRVAFEFTKSFQSSLAYSIDTLLDWGKYANYSTPSPMSGTPTDSASYFQAPQPTETAIEMPWHLVISPYGDAVPFASPGSEVTLGGATELWHAQLGGGGANVIATWNDDWHQDGGYAQPTLCDQDTAGGLSFTAGSDDGGTFPYVQSVTRFDRWNIVEATANVHQALGVEVVEGNHPAVANRLWLTSRGGYLDVEGSWDIQPKISGQLSVSLAEWRHIATLGRDHYVRIVNRGFLFPWGHRATLSSITERQFEPVAGGEVATLRQILFLTVLQPTLTYADASGNPVPDFPFTTVEIKTARTPPIQPEAFPSASDQPNDAIIGMTAAGTPFLFHMVGTDWSGRLVPFSAAAAFFPDEGGVTIDTSALIRAYNGHGQSVVGPEDPRRTAEFDGGPIAFGHYNRKGDTDLHVQGMTFGATDSGIRTPGVPTFRPTLSLNFATESAGGGFSNAQAAVRLPVAEQLGGGGPLTGNTTPSFAYHPSYAGFAPPSGASEVSHAVSATNPAEVFMTSATQSGNDVGANAANLIYGAGTSGGLVTPNININGLSRNLGPIGDPNNLINGTFNPAAFFGGLNLGKFLAGLDLGKLLQQTISVVDGGSLSNAVPQILRVPNPTDPTTIVTSFTWSPAFSSCDSSSPDYDTTGTNVWFAPGTGFVATLSGTITTDLAAPPPGNTTAVLNGVMGPFSVTLLSTQTAEFIEIDFQQVTFSSGTHQKTNIQPTGISVTFLGALSFINALQEVISKFTALDGGGGGVQVTVDANGVTVDMTVQIPPVALGIFTLAGIGFEAKVQLPLDGVTPAVFTFAVASVDNPFTISAGIFGGSGYFSMALETSGITSLTINFQFGASMSLDIGVASGGISLEAGITYMEGMVLLPNGQYATDPKTGEVITDGCSFQAMITLKGHLEILGLIGLSLEFDVTLSYYDDPSVGKYLQGTATLVLGLSIACFHPTVTMSVTKTLSGSGVAGSGSGSSARPRAVAAPQTTLLQWTDQIPDAATWSDYASAFETA